MTYKFIYMLSTIASLSSIALEGRITKVAAWSCPFVMLLSANFTFKNLNETILEPNCNNITSKTNLASNHLLSCSSDHVLHQTHVHQPVLCVI